MKTQIANLVNGNQLQVGTNHAERAAVADKVLSENPSTMTICIRGQVIDLTRSQSLSGKSVCYVGSLPLEVYTSMFGTFGLPKKNPSASIMIDGDLRVTVRTNSRKMFFNTINNSEITIC